MMYCCEGPSLYMPVILGKQCFLGHSALQLCKEVIVYHADINICCESRFLFLLDIESKME